MKHGSIPNATVFYVPPLRRPMYCGVDEAGRGSVMGPLVVGAVFTESDDVLLEIDVKDSKKLTPKRREAMYGEITSSVPGWSVEVVSAEDIDRLRKTMTLNEIEMDMFKSAVTRYPTKKVIADCPDVNEAGSPPASGRCFRLKPTLQQSIKRMTHTPWYRPRPL